MKRLTDLRRRSVSQAVRVAKYGALAVGSAQVMTAGAIVAIDEIRKLRGRPRITTFPTRKPVDISVDDTDVRIYSEGRTLYSDMLATIRTARDYIFFETFIWKDDPIGREFKAALIAAARRGVSVYVVYDGFANLVVNPAFKIFPTLKHLHLRRFPEVRSGLFTLNLRKTGRDHRKLLVADGRVGFIGGFNIGELYAEQWRDTHVRLAGAGVAELDRAFTEFWNYFRNRRCPRLPDPPAKGWDQRIQAALNSPNQLLFPVRGLYIDALDRAQERAYITSAYFIPDREIERALIAAAKRGVEVKILLPKKSNHIIADWVAWAHLGELLAAGVEIWLYRDAMIHAKTAVVDGRWATIGTANIDRLSMTGNYEANLQIHDSACAAVLEDIFANDLSNATRLDFKDWTRRGVITRGAEEILRPLGFML